MSHLRLRLVIAVGSTRRASSAGGALAAPTELFFSEYIEGSSNNKALEIYNGTGAPIDLAARRLLGADVLQRRRHRRSDDQPDRHRRARATCTSSRRPRRRRRSSPRPTRRTAPAGSTATTPSRSARARPCSTSIGQVGFDPGTEWGTGLTSTRTTRSAARRRSRAATRSAPTPSTRPSSGTASRPTPSSASARTSATPPPGDAAPSVALDHARERRDDVPLHTNVSVTFSEPVDVTAPGTRSRARHGRAHGDGERRPDDVHARPRPAIRAGESCTFTVGDRPSPTRTRTTRPTRWPPTTRSRFTTPRPPGRASTTSRARRTSRRSPAGASRRAGRRHGRRENGFYIQDPSPDARPGAPPRGLRLHGASADASPSATAVTVDAARVDEFRPGGAASRT